MEEQLNSYWCYNCKLEFIAKLQPGKDIIQCPQCHNDFCELTNQNKDAKKFEPYQKSPTKKKQNQLKILNRATPININ